MLKTALLSLIAAAALCAGQAMAKDATVDSLLQKGRGDGQTFTIYWLHSLADGTTVVDQTPVTLVSRPGRSGEQKILFDGALSNVSVRWHPDGNLPPKDAPPNHEKGARLQMVVHGEFVVEVSNGKTIHVHPGNFLLQEDSTGFGHKMHCDAPRDGLGCVQITMDAVDPATFFKSVKK